jgi:hypothetical protein
LVPPVPNREAPEQRAGETGSIELRKQESEFYELVMAVMARMPAGTTVAEALETPEGERVRRKWSFKYGRQPPL